MRPVNKGETPDKVFKKYQEAEPYLEERVGPYCSFVNSQSIMCQR